jgi:hypothetical protein
MQESTPSASPTMGMPPQAPPVDRSPSGRAAFAASAGIAASIDWSELLAQINPPGVIMDGFAPMGPLGF